MPAATAPKGPNHALRAADVTRPLAGLSGANRGVASSDPSTRGHVGADALPHLVTVAAPDTLVALSINAGVHVGRGFDRALARLDGIAGLPLTEVPICGASRPPRATAPMPPTRR
jgi:hypothetical protein